MQKLEILVTGTGRCGTVFMARWLTALGKMCGHEAVFSCGGLGVAKHILKTGDFRTSWTSTHNTDSQDWFNPAEMVAESSYLAAPFLNDPMFDDSKLLHIVRNPTKVVNSFCNYVDYFRSSEPANDYEAFIYRHIPELKRPMSQCERAALYYILWNESIEPRAGLRWQAEGKHDVVLEWLELSGEPYTDHETNTYKKPGPRFALSNIESKEIRDRFVNKGKYYGYDLLEHSLL